MKAYGPWIGYGVISVLFLISQVFAQRAPRLDRLEPPVVDAGQELVIHGNHFGNDPGNATLLIGGTTITRSQIVSWDDQVIRVRVSETLGSGLVTVSTKEGRSQGLLLASRRDLPRFKDSQEGIRGAVIKTLTPSRIRPYEEVILGGDNLGSTATSGLIYLPWGPVKDLTPSSGEREWTMVSPELITLWSPKEIRFRVPEGTVSGPLKIQYKNTEVTAGGLNLDDSAATRAYHSRRILSLSYSFDLVVQTAGEGAEILIWAPNFPETGPQRKVSLLSESLKPSSSHLADGPVAPYRFSEVGPGFRTRVTREFQTEIYAQEVNFRPELIQEAAASALPEVQESLLKADLQIPSSSQEILQASTRARGGVTTAYAKANAIYRWLLGNVLLDLDRTSRTPLGALQAGKANVYEMAVLFTSLARASQIPSRLVGGYVLTGPKSLKPHFWSEIRIPSVGWIPVDPALAAGLKYGSFPEVPDPKNFYFGNMDNRHLVLSHGSVLQQKTSSRSQVKAGGLPGSLQTIAEEVTGNLENYSLIWHDVTVTGNY